MKKEQPGVRKRFKEDVDSAGNTGHPERDQFLEGKIGSGYMSTIEGQPNLQGSANELDDPQPEKNKIKNIKEQTPEPVEQ